MKVAIVGGGFAGLIFAVKLAEAGVRVTVYEEHSAVGVPRHCTGLVSMRTVRLIGDPALSSVENVYELVRLVGRASSVTVLVEGGVARLDRRALEEKLLEKAERLGARIELNSRVDRVSADGSVKARGSWESYDLVLLAEGYMGALRRALGLTHEPRVVYGVNRDYLVPARGRAIEVYLGERYPHGFFAWRIPRGSETTLGLGAREKRVATRLLDRLERELALGEPRATYGGTVVLGPPSSRIRAGRVLVVGDAAALNKPLTGGGLYPNALAAEIAGRLIRRGGSLVESVEASVAHVAREMRVLAPIARLAHENPVLVEEALRALERALEGELMRLDYDRHGENLVAVATRILRSRGALGLLNTRALASLASSLLG
ncbi:MAG: NAD(P)/FAD-dependent oxidoreductase [Acidilobaceae archaeon]